MKLICKNHIAMKAFAKRIDPRGGRILEVRVIPDDFTVNIVVDVDLKALSEFERVRINFVECFEYEFYDKKPRGFFPIEKFKILEDKSEGFFTSFDPVKEDKKRSDKDGYFVHCAEVHVYLF